MTAQGRVEAARVRLGLRGLAATLALAVVASCTSREAPEPEPARPDVVLGFTQILPEEGSRQALLRVVNPGDRTIEVTAVGIAWEGYGDVLQPTDRHKEIPASAQLMLRFELPPPRCTPRPAGRVRGRLTVDGVDIEQQLTSPAQVYVRRLWRTQCEERLIDRTVALRWRLEKGPVRVGRLETELVLARRRGNERIEVLSTDGSVLYRIPSPRRAILSPGRDALSVPLAILPGNRCDEHAIGQATAPYDFSLRLRVGSRRVLMALQPPLAIQQAASRMLLRHCGSSPGRG